MCVIISKPGGIVIPPEKIESAWQNNKDGVGITFIDRDKFEVRKWLSKDPDDINKFLEQIHDMDAMLHLRFSTKGKVNYENLHPFTVLNKAKHGVDLQFFHNGTLYEFGDNEVSDSNDFVNTIVRPLYELVAKDADGDIGKVLDNELAQKIVEKYRTASSVFTVFSGTGDWMHWGAGHTFKEEGWWASNNLYFNNPSKRENAANQNTKTTTHYPKAASATSAAPASSNLPANVVPPATDEVPFDTETGEVLPKPVESESTLTELGLDSLDELCYYNQEDLEEIVREYPYETACLLRELLNELYWENIQEKSHAKAT